MPTFSPLARGFGTWTGELHLDENEKDGRAGPSLPSLLDGVEHSHGVTIRAKSAVSSFRSTADRPELGGKTPIPKTYLTRKGAIVLFAAPDDPGTVELSERDRAYLRKTRRKLLKHRYADYSNKIGSVHRLAQSVFCFGDEDFPAEDVSVTDPENKANFKFLHSPHDQLVDRKSRPGYNFDMYFDGFMSRCGSSLSTSRPTTGRPHTARESVDSAVETVSNASEDPDLLSADGESLVKRLIQPAPPPEGRSSPSSRFKRRMNTEQLAASLKSGGYLGRQTIVEEEVQRRSESVARSRKSSSSRGSRRGSGRLTTSPVPDTLGVDAVETDRQSVREDEYLDGENDEQYEESDTELDTSAAVQPLLPVYSATMISPGLLSSASGGTFSFSASHVDDYDEEQEAATVYDSVSLPQDGAPSIHSVQSADTWADHVAEQVLMSQEKLLAESASEVACSELSARSKSRGSSRPKSRESVKSAKSQLSSAREDELVEQPSEEYPQETEMQGVADEEIEPEADTEQPEVEAEVDEERPASRASSHASSHSGVPSENDEAEQLLDDEQVLEHVEGTEHQILEPEATSNLSESKAQLLESTSPVGEIEPSREAIAESIKAEFFKSQLAKLETPVIAENLERPKTASSLASSITNDDVIGVTDVTITPRTRSAASKPETATLQPRPAQPPTKEETKSTKASSLAPVPVKDTKQPTKPEVKKPEPKVTPTPKAAQPPKATPQPKSVPPKEEPKKKEELKKPEKKQPTPAPTPSKAKPEEKKETKPVKEIQKPEAKKPEPKKHEPKPSPTPGKKIFTKAFDITVYDKKEEKAEVKSAPIVKKPVEASEPAKPAPREIKEFKPESLVSDTKAELMRLFGTLPTKQAEKKKEPVRKKRVVIRVPPGPPPKTKEEKELDKLEKEVLGGESLTKDIPLDEEGGGLTVEELELEQQLLQEKLLQAENRIKGENTGTPVPGKSPRTPREVKKKGKKGEEEKSEIEKKREALKEGKRLEKQKRLEEAKRIEGEMKKNEEEKKQELEKQTKQKKALECDIEDMKRAAEDAELAEEDARTALLEVRKQAREERETRRREEQERKKQEASSKRDDERKRREAARQREAEMLMRIASKDEQIRMREDERLRREEEEDRVMMEDEEQERLERNRIEEEEAKIADLEREVEEQALAALIQDRDEALIKKRQMEEQARVMEEEEERLRLQWEAEQEKLAAEQRHREDEDARRREAERLRLQGLQRIEQEARDRMRLEIQRRRDMLLRRRDQNIERRHHLDSLKTRQGMTKSWVFTYYVTWPRETYMKRMGAEDDKKKRGKQSARK